MVQNDDSPGEFTERDKLTDDRTLSLTQFKHRLAQYKRAVYEQYYCPDPSQGPLTTIMATATPVSA